MALPLYVKLELRAMTNSDLNRDSAVMMSSTMPSAKYSCSVSPDMFWNGSTAIDGLSGKASGTSTGGADGASVEGAETLQSGASHLTPKACTGLSMFLR